MIRRPRNRRRRFASPRHHTQRRQRPSRHIQNFRRRADVRMLDSRQALNKLDMAIAEVDDIRAMLNLYGRPDHDFRPHARNRMLAARQALAALEYLREIVEEVGL